MTMAGAKKPSIAAPKTLLDKIIHAIRAQPAKNPNGVSRAAITKYLQSELDVDKSKYVPLRNAFKKGVETGRLVQSGQSFLVVGDPAPDPPEEPKIRVEDLREGTGPVAEAGDKVLVKYEGRLKNGRVFDRSSTFSFTLGTGEVIRGWDQGILGMRKDGKRKLFVPFQLGYGERGAGAEVPPNADLYFTVKVKKITKWHLA